ncbi:MAG: hypothetical protein QW794_01910 [Thermosphaera sp.]
MDKRLVLGLMALLLATALIYAATPYKNPYQYSEEHQTLWGKIAALAHYDVIKTTEPRLCSNGAANYTCFLSKTDIAPILKALNKTGVKPEVAEIEAKWVLVLDIDYTAVLATGNSSPYWRNYTVIKAWELTWNNQTARVYQVRLRWSYGELIKAKDLVVEKLLYKDKVKGITSVAPALERIVVTTKNATSDRKPDPNATETIKKKIKEIDSDLEVEVAYAEEARPTLSRGSVFNPLVGGINITLIYRYTPNYLNISGCTLGFTGMLYGSIPVIVTAWHCSFWIWGSSVRVYQPTHFDYYIGNQYQPAGCTYRQIDAYTIETYCDIMTIPVDTSRRTTAPQIFRPYDVDWGTVTKVLGRYDVPWLGTLTKAGRTTDIAEGYLWQYCRDTIYYQRARHGDHQGTRVVIHKITVKCTVDIAWMNIWYGDSGGPVYVVGPFIGLNSREVYAYGITSGFYNGTLGERHTIVSPLDAYHLYVRYT